VDGRPGPEPAASLRDMVVQRVRSDIVSGRTPPGTLYSVPALAEEIGVSTTPVREALLELSRSGLVAPRRNRGFRVEPTSLEDLNDLFAMRELLERFAITALAARRPTDEAALRRLADEVAAAVGREDVRGYVEADRAFHRELVAQAGNPLLARLVMELRDAVRLYGIDSTAGRRRQVESAAEHHRLVELASAGEAEAAAELMSRHILDWRPIFTAAIPGRDKGGPERGQAGPERGHGHSHRHR
jgi:DNA-binding GntR family transcriptional regulator